MAPKPFQPPRPTSSAISKPQSKSKSKSTTSPPLKPRSKPGPKPGSKRVSTTSLPRTSISKPSKIARVSTKIRSPAVTSSRSRSRSLSLSPSPSVHRRAHSDTSPRSQSQPQSQSQSPSPSASASASDPFSSHPKTKRTPRTTTQSNTTPHHAANEDENSDADVDAEAEADEPPFSDRTHRIPLPLLARLLADFFTDPNTRIQRDANAAVGRYVETFVREALARGVFLGEEERGRGGGGGSGGGGILEVEDLEKLAPQLLLDF